MASEKITVATPSLAYGRMTDALAMVRDILGGTQLMRKAGTKYLPQHPNESNANYFIRLAIATFTPLFKVTVENMVGRVFAEEMMIKDADPVLAKNMENADLAGNHVSIFARNVFKDALANGLSWIYVDYSKGLPTKTVAEEMASGARPYFVWRKAEDVIFVKFGANGEIEEARFREVETVPDGQWGQKNINKIRVVTPGKFQIWKQKVTTKLDKEPEWELETEETFTLQMVPLIPVYTGKIGDGEAVSPLIEVAYLNLKYYQCQSNYDSAVSVSMFPLLAASGWTANDPEISIGPKKLLMMENPTGKFYYVEHAGTALAAGIIQLEGIKADCVLQGARILMPTRNDGVQTTATQETFDATREICPLQAMARGLSDSMENALMLHDKWLGKDTKAEVVIKGLFEETRENVQEFATLAGMNTAGQISLQTLWDELKRRKFLSETFDPKKEKELLAMDGPPDFFTPPGAPRAVAPVAPVSPVVPAAKTVAKAK